MSSPTEYPAFSEEHANADQSLSSVPGSDSATQGTTGVGYSTDDNLPDLVDDEGRVVNAAAFDEPEEIEEARTSFSVPSSRERMMWPPLTPPPAFPELFPLQESPTVQASPSANPDEEGET